MKNVRINPVGAVLILLGITVPVIVFFVSLWQTHPDPSAFKPGDFSELVLVLRKGGFAVLVDGEPVDRDSIAYDESDNIVIDHPYETLETVRDWGRMEIPVRWVFVAGGLAFVAGSAAALKKKR